jgi:WD40 repeat protein
MLRLGPRLRSVRMLGFSPDNRFLLAVGMEQRLGGLLRFERLALWDLADPAAVLRPMPDAGFDPQAVFFLPDGLLVGIDSRGSWRVARIDGGRVVGAQSRLRGPYTPAAVSPDGLHAALLGRGEFRCVLLLPNAVGWEDRHPTYEQPTAAAFSPNGRRVAVAWVNSDVPDHREAVGGGAVYDVDTGVEVAGRLEWGHRARLAWSPDGTRIAAAGRHEFALLGTDLRHGDEWAGEDDGPALTAAAFHPAGAFVTADDAGRVVVWDAGPEPGRVLDWGIGAVQALAFSPDGSLGAVAGRRGEVVVWDVDA